MQDLHFLKKNNNNNTMYVCNLYFLEQKGIFIHKITAMKNHKKIK